MRKPPTPPSPPLSPKAKLEQLAASGYVDINDAQRFIADVKATRPDRAVLREIKLALIKHQSMFDKGAFYKLKSFCDGYKAENDV